MALTATLYTFTVALNDADRCVYESLDLRLACHPSETPGFMLTRLLAYCLEYEEGIAFTDGICAGELCAVQVADLTGRLSHWIEIGAPPAERLHRGSKLAGRATVYTHKSPDKVQALYRRKVIHEAGAITLVNFAPGFVEAVVPALERRNELSVAVSGGQLYLDLNGLSLATSVERRQLAG